MAKSIYDRQHDIFLDLLRRTRESVPLRQEDVGRLIGRHQGTVSRVETGESRLDVIELRAWLNAMGVDFMGFMGELHSRLDRHNPVDLRFQRRRPPPKFPIAFETSNRSRRR
ncbi:MAG: helix-turn-helix transcriptional regulator [Rhizobacter sp.]|nr:helix-turn-helix transcriptional regulator [Rhizobacter sp.]